jgi:uncharacterized protein (TIGR01244 family)
MARFTIARVTATAAVFAAFPAVLTAQTLTGPNPTAEVPAPVVLEPHGQFQDKLASVGSDVFISGQPTEQGIRDLHARGVTTIVNLRTPEEMSKRVPFDEAALAKSLGITYVYIPVRGNAEFPYSPAALKTFAAAMTDAKGKVLLHCTVAWRASHIWAAYLIEYRHVPVETALAQARSINLMDDMRMEGNEQPVESFLGRKVPEVGHPKAQ